MVATLTHRPENSAFSACDDISLGQMVLFDSFSCRLFMSSPNGQLHSITLKVFGRQCRSKAEFNGLRLSAKLSTLRHNFIPNSGTTVHQE